MMIGRGSILALLLAATWLLGLLPPRHNSSGSLGLKWRLPLCSLCPPLLEHTKKREKKKNPTTAATWLDHYFQVRGNIAVNSEVSSWLLLWSSGNACTAMLHASYVGVTLRRILVSYASGRKLKSSGHHFISKTSSRKTQHHNFQAQKYQ